MPIYEITQLAIRKLSETTCSAARISERTYDCIFESIRVVISGELRRTRDVRPDGRHD